MENVIVKASECRGCKSTDLKKIFCLNPTPVGDEYVEGYKVSVEQPLYPIDLYMCQECNLAQLIDIVQPESIYADYIYLTESSTDLSPHFKDYAQKVSEKIGLPKKSRVVDIGSNDGTLLNCFKNLDYTVIGVEPSGKISALANARGLKTYNAYFNAATATEIVDQDGKADLITSNNVFANVPDLHSWIEGINVLLSDNGVYVFESYYLMDVVKNFVFDFIYHEHLTSFSVKPVVTLFEKFNLKVASIDWVPTKGGSLRYYITKPGNSKFSNDKTVAHYLKLEDEFKLYDPATYEKFHEDIMLLKKASKECLDQLKAEGKTVAAFGASITGTTLIYHFELEKYFPYLIDDNIAKQGTFSPGLHLPVYTRNAIRDLKPDYIYILAWRFADKIIKNNQDYIKAGGKFIVPVPFFKIVDRA
ncbi:MAG: class I SAM-dependent methyltransferase [Sediminibacterium sp.]